jgi:predicted DNA-binding WGR domain protein
MKRTFVYTDEKSNKFWSIETSGTDFTVTYGKVGSDGQTSEKSFASNDECKKAADKLIAEKTKKGYIEQGAGGNDEDEDDEDDDEEEDEDDE